MVVGAGSLSWNVLQEDAETKRIFMLSFDMLVDVAWLSCGRVITCELIAFHPT